MKCGDCGVKEGELHVLGCDMERCKKCKGQLISCDCGHLLNDTLEKLKDEEREPYFLVPLFCIKCSKKYPNFFMVSDEDWKNVCGATYELDCLLCEECFDKIASLRGIDIKNKDMMARVE